MTELRRNMDTGKGYKSPQLVEQGVDTIMVLRGTRSAPWFDLVNGVYVGRYGTKFTLAHDTGAGVFNLAAPNGEITVFNDFASTHPGLFKSQSTAGGESIQVTSYAPTTMLGIGEV